MAQIDFDLLINNPQAKTIISLGGGGRPTTAFMISELTMFGRNETNSLIDTSAQQELSKKVNLGRSLLQSSIGQKIGGAAGINTTNLQNISIINFNQTIEEWTASAKPVFTINVMWVAMRTGDDVRIPATKLFRAVYPTSTQRGFMRAPLNLAPRIGRGLSTLHIGTWFKAPRQIIKEVSITFSREIVKLDPQGTKTAPLFAVGTIQFSPFRMITYQEARAYLFQDQTVRESEFYKVNENAQSAARAISQEDNSGGIGGLLKKGLGF